MKRRKKREGRGGKRGGRRGKEGGGKRKEHREARAVIKHNVICTHFPDVKLW